jgi:hypothetical protein
VPHTLRRLSGTVRLFEMDWLRSEDLKEERVGNHPTVTVTGQKAA